MHGARTQILFRRKQLESVDFPSKEALARDLKAELQGCCKVVRGLPGKTHCQGVGLVRPFVGARLALQSVHTDPHSLITNLNRHLMTCCCCRRVDEHRSSDSSQASIMPSVRIGALFDHHHAAAAMATHLQRQLLLLTAYCAIMASEQRCPCCPLKLRSSAPAALSCLHHGPLLPLTSSACATLRTNITCFAAWCSAVPSISQQLCRRDCGAGCRGPRDDVCPGAACRNIVLLVPSGREERDG